MITLMEDRERDVKKEVKKQLKKHLRGVGGSTIETLVKRLGVLPHESVLLTTDIGLALAATNLRAGIEMLKAGRHVTACGKGYDCDPGEPKAIVLPWAGIDYFKDMSADSVFYLPIRGARFRRGHLQRPRQSDRRPA